MNQSSVAAVLDCLAMQSGAPGAFPRSLLFGAPTLALDEDLASAAASIDLHHITVHLHRSYAARHSDQRRSLDEARAAARHAFTAVSRGGIHPGLSAVIWAYLANALRINAYLGAASRCWANAEKSIHALAAAPRMKGLVHELHAAYFVDVRHFAAALEAYEHALSCYRELPHHAGLVELQIAYTLSASGDHQKALDHLDRSLGRLEPGQDPSLSLSVYHNRITLLIELGHLRQAMVLYHQIEPLYDALGQDLIRLRGLWLKARLALRCEGHEEAVEALRSVVDGFVERQLSYDAALAGLDLALALSRCDRHREVQKLAEEMVPVFTGHRIEREARMALLQWVEAVRAEEADAETVAGTIEALHQVARTPLDLSRRPRRG